MPFVKGQSGNPGGRPKDLQGIKALCQTHAPKAIAAAVKILNSKTAKDTDKLKAADLILDRAYGKPLQEVKGVAFNRYTAIWTKAIGRLKDVDAEGHVQIRRETLTIEPSDK